MKIKISKADAVKEIAQLYIEDAYEMIKYDELDAWLADIFIEGFTGLNHMDKEGLQELYFNLFYNDDCSFDAPESADEIEIIS